MSELSEALERQLRKIQGRPAPVVIFADPDAEKPNTSITLPVVAAPPVYAKHPPVGPSITNLPSPKQVSFFKDLVARKQLSDAQRAHMLGGLSVMDKRAISSTIQWLIGLPWMPRPVTVTMVPDKPCAIDQGYYAIVDPLDQVLKFYQVRRPNHGHWAGYVFLSQVSGENHFSVRARMERQRIFSVIEKDILGALKRFGKEIGQCGHCRKQLTDEVSREFGIGPVCRKVLGV